MLLLPSSKPASLRNLSLSVCSVRNGAKEVTPLRHNLWTVVRNLLTLRFWFILAQYFDDSVAVLMFITFLIL